MKLGDFLAGHAIMLVISAGVSSTLFGLPLLGPILWVCGCLLVKLNEVLTIRERRNK